MSSQATVHLAAPRNPNNATAVAFSTRGLPNMQVARMFTSSTSAHPVMASLALTLWTTNLLAILYAFLSGTAVNIFGETFFDLVTIYQGTTTFLNAPDVLIAVHNRVNAMFIEVLKDFDDVTQNATTKGGIVYRTQWTAQKQTLLSQAKVQFNMDTIGTPGCISVTAAKCFGILSRLVGLYCENQPDTFDDVIHNEITSSIVPGHRLDSVGNLVTAWRKIQAGVFKGWALLFQNPKAIGSSSTEDISTTGTLSFLVNPENKQKRTNWFSSASGIPRYSGLCFPYFPQMLIADRETLLSYIRRKFYHALGSNKEQCDLRFQSVEKGWANLANTNEGKVFVHIFEGIEMANTSGARLHLIIENGIYLGFLLLGENFRVLQRDRVYIPQKHDVLYSEVLEMSAHMNALRQIAGLLSISPLRSTNEPAPVDQKDISTGRDLYERTYERKISLDAMTSMKDLLPKLAFSDQYVTPGKDDLVRFLRSTRDNVRISDGPFYISGETWFERDNIPLLNLARFGPKAPSFSDIRGASEIQIPSLNTEDTTVKIINGKRSIESVPVYVTGLKAAADQYNKLVRKHVVTITKGDRGNYPRAKIAYHGPMRDDLVEALRYVVTAKEGEESNDGNGSGKKRAREDDDNMDIEGRKKSKVFSFGDFMEDVLM